jgi:ADP-ribosyl-[dinitrogen reductase] hydrolase
MPIVDKHIGHLKIAFMWAFYYLKNEYTFKQALEDILKKGGDTDTNAAIVGGLLGTFHGIKGINEEWIQKILVYTPEKAHDSHKQIDFVVPAYYLP